MSDIEAVLQRIENTRVFHDASTGHYVMLAADVVALLECARALEMLLQYIDDHNWGNIPEGETGDVARAALAKLAELDK